MMKITIEYNDKIYNFEQGFETYIFCAAINNDYIVDYKGVKCHALFNWFVCQFYADDVYRRVEE